MSSLFCGAIHFDEIYFALDGDIVLALQGPADGKTTMRWLVVWRRTGSASSASRISTRTTSTNPTRWRPSAGDTRSEKPASI
jgi:hypothetical protein